MLKSLFKFIVSLVLVSSTVFFIITFVARPVKVNDDSMSPTFKKGDYVIVNIFNKTTNQIDREKVVLIKRDGSYTLKRIIATSSCTVKMENDRLYINNVEYAEPYLNQEMINNSSKPYTNDFTVTLGEDEYFVLGDNRQNSVDSRNGLGVIKESEIMSSGVIHVFTGGENK